MHLRLYLCACVFVSVNVSASVCLWLCPKKVSEKVQNKRQNSEQLTVNQQSESATTSRTYRGQGWPRALVVCEMKTMVYSEAFTSKSSSQWGPRTQKYLADPKKRGPSASAQQVQGPTMLMHGQRAPVLQPWAGKLKRYKACVGFFTLVEMRGGWVGEEYHG